MKFSVGGIIVLSIIFWSLSQSATGDARKVYNLFLMVLLTSMILLNWSKVEPILFKKG